MSNTQELRERMNSYGIHDKECGVTITHDLGNCDCSHTEFLALIHDREREARIDELTTLISNMNAGDEFLAEPTEANKGWNLVIMNRLASLQATKPEKEG